MLESLQKMKLQTAVKLGILFYLIVIITHILIISSFIPYTWINGGLSESYNAQVSLSIQNIVVALIGMIFTLIAGNVIKTKLKRTITIICWVFVGYWTIGFLMQLFGTSFERWVISWTIILALIVNLRFAIEKR